VVDHFTTAPVLLAGGDEHVGVHNRRNRPQMVENGIEWSCCPRRCRSPQFSCPPRRSGGELLPRPDAPTFAEGSAVAICFCSPKPLRSRIARHPNLRMVRAIGDRASNAPCPPKAAVYDEAWSAKAQRRERIQSCSHARKWDRRERDRRPALQHLRGHIERSSDLAQRRIAVMQALNCEHLYNTLFPPDVGAQIQNACDLF
jgi:hypothetical protein